jgi:cytidyltransferase-like protein
VTRRTALGKVMSRQEIVRRFERTRRSGSLVFTNGCFELLHAGHVDYLERARALGDALLVAVNSDASGRRRAQGNGRPNRPQAHRALRVAALD